MVQGSQKVVAGVCIDSCRRKLADSEKCVGDVKKSFRRENFLNQDMYLFECNLSEIMFIFSLILELFMDVDDMVLPSQM